MTFPESFMAMLPGSRRRVAVAMAVVSAGLIGPGESRAQEASGRRVLRHEITSELRLAVDRGFGYLLREQRPSGNFGTKFPVASNALVGLALLAGGYTSRDGPYTEAMQSLIDKLLTYQKPSGYFHDGDNLSRMYGHGFATLFLAQLYGMTGSRDRQIHDALQRAVALIEKSQCNDGGWDYYPSMKQAPKIPMGLSVYSGTSDTSITVCQTMALRAARNLGITVNPRVIARAKHFIEQAQNTDGGFRYRMDAALIPEFKRSRFPRSAAGVCILLSLGEYETADIRRGFEYLETVYRKRESDFPFYAHYYCAQAMFQAGGRYWRDYFPHIRQKLIRFQRRDGSWKGKHGGSVQATAMALIVLETPYRFLPISER